MGGLLSAGRPGEDSGEPTFCRVRRFCRNWDLGERTFCRFRRFCRKRNEEVPSESKANFPEGRGNKASNLTKPQRVPRVSYQ